MAHDVFVSYSTKDKTIADTIVASLEQNQIRCWYAPRDIQASEDWGKAITNGILKSKMFLVIFSGNANQSQRVLDELNFAISKEIVILPIRIEKLEPDGAMGLHLSSRHWLDAYDPSWKSHIGNLIKNVSVILETSIDEQQIVVPAHIEKKHKQQPKKLTRIVAWIAVGIFLITAGWYGWSLLNIRDSGNPEFSVKGTTPLQESLAVQAPETPIEEPVVDDPDVGEPFRIGFIYIGVPGDLGWTFEHEQGRLKLEEEFGDLIETTTVESVGEGPDAERVMQDFAQQGFDMIFATSFGCMDAMYEESQQYPDIIFEHASGYTTSENMATYFGRMYQPRYLSGVVAGLMTETNSIGYVAAFPIPEVIRGINAFTLGVRSVNPEAQVRVVWTNTWYDPPTEREAAISLLDEGVDVIAQHQDTTEPQKAAQEYGVMSIGYNSDMREFVGESVLTGPVWNWGTYYIDTVRDALAGEWQTGEFWGGMDTGVVLLADFSDLVPQDVRDAVEEARSTIIAEDAVFCGPINGQDGEVMVPDGECMSDGEMLGMSWFVEGVVGTIN